MRRHLIKTGLLVLTLIPLLGACSYSPTAPQMDAPETETPNRSQAGSQG
jgi:hypothetical protein